jgi:putative NADH-flavin reductase
LSVALQKRIIRIIYFKFYKEKMNQITTIAVLGGGGRTGKFLVAKLIEKGYRLKVLLRSPENFELRHPLVEAVKGDAIDPVAIHALLKNSHAVISTVGQRKNEPLVAYAATTNVLKAMTYYEIRRYLLVAGINIDTPFDKKGIQTLAATDWMKANFPLIQVDRQKAYQVMLASPLDWTLVRVPMIEFTDDAGNLKISVEDCLGTRITAGDIANFLVQQLTDHRFFRQAPFIAA